MKPRTDKQKTRVIVYDAECMQQPGPELFDTGYWESTAAVAGRVLGRGSVLFLETDFGSAVLRQYLRGGWPAYLSRDRYFFTAYQRSRPIMEFRILVELQRLDLPAPRPLAAMCQRHGLFYSGALLTRRIPDATPLADLLAAGEAWPDAWRLTGACIRRFHDHGVVHADLNARNIMVGRKKKIYLLDFDRARICMGADSSFRSNLARLHRSLNKLWPSGEETALSAAWSCLMEGYDGPGHGRTTSGLTVREGGK